MHIENICLKSAGKYVVEQLNETLPSSQFEGNIE